MTDDEWKKAEQKLMIEEKAENIGFVDIGVDFGSNESFTTFVATKFSKHFDTLYVLPITI